MIIETARLSIPRIETAYKNIEPIFLNSPQFISDPLSKILNCTLIIKDETQNPVGSFKGRGAEWLVSQLPNAASLICASAGNFGQAMAYSCEKKRIPLTVFTSKNANEFKVERILSLNSIVIQIGEDFDEAKTEAQKVALKTGERFIEDSLDIETLEGAGTIGLELLKFSEKIDYLLIALGNGAMINGVAAVFKEFAKETKIIAVQSAGAPAMIESWKTGRLINYPSVNTIADGIAVRKPVPQALEDMKGLVDEGILVQDESIIKAIKLIYQNTGIIAEASAAVGIAAVLENPEKFANKRVCTIICGGNLTQQQKDAWL